jgi:putative oxidoreductase
MGDDIMLTRPVNIALLILRIGLGVIFIAHGGQKLFGWFGGGGLSSTAGFLGKMGFTPPVLWAVLLTLSEFGGGLFVLLGLLTRFAAASIIIGQIVAVATVHWRGGFFLPKGFEYNFILIAVALALVLTGAGMISLDWLLRRRRT